MKGVLASSADVKIGPDASPLHGDRHDQAVTPFAAAFPPRGAALMKRWAAPALRRRPAAESPP